MSGRPGAMPPAAVAAAGSAPTTAVLPAGVPARATTVLQRAAALLGELAGDGSSCWTVDAGLVEAHVLLPLVLAAANGLARPDAPPAPVPAPGGGWVHVDVGPDDADTWVTLQAVVADEVRAGGPPPDAEQLARRAQEWRLAVTPYRHRPPGPGPAATGRRAPGPAGSRPAGPTGPTGRAAPATTGRRSAPGPVAPLHGVRIVDLTAMWAGPLATWLAAEAGAEVVKVEAACRPDGLRRGPRPAAAGHGDGAHFVALDGGKEHVELDLRRPADLARFDALVATADVVIDSFSPRVRPNLGIAPDRLAALRPGLVDVSLTAFDPDGPAAAWVAYGGGLHAWSGLAWPAAGPPRPAVVPYADPLAGFETFAAIVAALAERHRGHRGPWRLTPSLEAAVAPLAAPDATTAGRTAAGAGDPGRGLPDVGDRVLRAAALLTEHRDGCRVPPSPLLRCVTGSATHRREHR